MPVQVSLGPHLKGYAMPHPDLQDKDTAILGVCHRFGRAPPPALRGKIEKLREFVGKWIHENLTPLSPDTVIDFDEWLESTPYTMRRKEELRSKRLPEGQSAMSVPKTWKVKSFIKAETYPEYKHARGINSRSDEFKCAIGPWFKKIEKQVFQHSAFIKKIPVSDRPDYIMNLLHAEGGSYMVSDYTSFEALFVAELMDAVEIQMYKYMTQFVPGHKDFWSMLDEVLAGENLCQFKTFLVKISATRMSGEMCTSLGNGFSNLMFNLFLCSEAGSEVVGVVEGDDGLFRLKGRAPTMGEYEELGLRVKVEFHDSISTAMFCGILFDELEKANLYDPRKALANFGLGSFSYLKCKQSTLRSLLRCKSLSLLHQFPGCPIIQSLGQYGERVTRGSDTRSITERRPMDEYTRERYRDACSAKLKALPVGMRSRLLMEKVFGISIHDQIQIEEMLDRKNDLEPINVNIDFPLEWSHYYYNYTSHFNVPLDPNFEIQSGKSDSWKELFGPTLKGGRWFHNK
jgi:hypothetical protein